MTARRKKTSPAIQPAKSPAAKSPAREFRIALCAFVFLVLAFYWKPLTNPNTTQQWDTIDYTYCVQKYVSEELKSFRLPHWTEFAYSGYPFLSDPQVAAWYPLNWPFFLVGITPKTMQWELALHALLACMGAWLLARVLLRDELCAGLVAITYGFSGFFAGHASHLNVVQAAAWLPLALFGVHTSMRSVKVRNLVLTGLACTALFMPGQFQIALYSFAAIAVYAVVVAAMEKRWRAAIIVLTTCGVMTVLLSCILWLPSLELYGQSTRAAVRFLTQTNAALEPRALWTLVSPDHYGSVSGNYTGPQDQTQFYFYAGLAVVPLAILGLAFKAVRWFALALIVPFGWYAFGPAGGLYGFVAGLPGFGAVRAPVHAWFVVALGFALLSGAGLALISRARLHWFCMAVAILTFGDLVYWNCLENHLSYFHGSYQARYGGYEETFKRAVLPTPPDGARLYSQVVSNAVGPMNSAYYLHVPVTYGYTPVPLKRYREYADAAAGNANLLNALNVWRLLTPGGGATTINTRVLPKFFFPKRISSVDSGQALTQLVYATPFENALVEGSIEGLSQDDAASVVVDSAEPQRYVLHSDAKSPSLMRAAIPSYPAWHASVDGNRVETRIVDHAMIGIPIPAGKHQVVLRYVAVKFRMGAAVTLLTLCAAIAVAVRGTGSRLN
jgi:Bacterial membrane protein YfhO